MKQTPIYYSMLAAFAFFCAAGCSNDEIDNTPQQPDEPAGGNTGVNVQFTAGLGPDTRTTHEPDGQAQEGFIVKWKGHDADQTSYDKVGILVENPTTQTSVDGAKNVPYRPTTSDTSSSLEADGTALSGLEVGNTYNFYSYYPYVEDQDINLANETVPNLKEQTQAAPGDNKHIGTYDFIYAQQKGVTIEAGSNPPTVDFQYKHLFSSLQFNLKNGRSTAVQINKITLERQDGSKMMIPDYYSFQAGKVGSSTQADFQQLTVTSPADLSANRTQKFWMMLDPESIKDATELKLSVYLSHNDENYLYTLKKAVPQGGFEAGYNYTLEMDVKDTGLSADESWTTLIATKDELKAFRDKVNGGTTYTGQTVRLTDHIDLTDETWTPIGNYDNNFKGTFDGGGYHINNLKIDVTGNYAGLFGRMENAAVRNLRVSGNVMTTGKYAGGIVGYAYQSPIKNCIFNGNVKGKESVGGIIGCNSASIVGCYTTGKVEASDKWGGGIIGYNGAPITDCYSSATVEITNLQAGGIAGTNHGETIIRCYATGAISTEKQAGGIVGYYEGTVEKCIALNPSITRTTGNQYTFGRVYYTTFGTSSNCAAFANMQVLGQTVSNGNANNMHGTDLTAAECLTVETYTSHDFTTENGWAFDSNTTWQYLPWNKAFESFPGITADDYRIKVPDHLKSTTP